MLSYFFRCYLGFSCIMMFRFHGSANLSGCWDVLVNVHLVAEERNAYNCLFILLVQYGTGQISFSLP
jgi:hypothetical protein